MNKIQVHEQLKKVYVYICIKVYTHTHCMYVYNMSKYILLTCIPKTTTAKEH